jgi:ABC-type sulfate transport system permease component
MSFAGLGGYRGTIVTTLVATVGAVLLTVLVAYVNGRRIYARQL